MKLNPYLTFPGTATQAIELYKKVFQADPGFVQRFKEIPSMKGMPVPSPAAGERIMHASFQVGDDMLMISDAPDGQDDIVISGTQTQVSLHPDSKEEANRIFGLLSKDGEVIMPMEDAFWGDYFGMCKDQFGIRWMINFHEEKQ